MLMALSLHSFGKKYLDSELLKPFLISVGLKILATISLAYIFMYEFEYKTDPQVIFSESSLLTERCLKHPEQIKDIFIHNTGSDMKYLDDPRTFILIKTCAVLNLFTCHNYWINSLWMSCLCFVSIWYLIISIRKINPDFYIPILLALLFVPTTLFWSSGLIKETVSASMLCILVVFLLKIYINNNSFKYIVLSILPAYILYRIKFYALGGLLLVAIPVLVIRFIDNQKKLNPYFKTGIFLILFIANYLILNSLCEYIFTVGISDLIFYNYEAFVLHSKTDVLFEGLKEFEPSSFLPHLPAALWHGLFMPLPWDGHSFFMYLEGIINLITLLSGSWLVFSILSNRNKTFSNNPVLTCIILFYILISAICITLSTPNWGTLARYKVLYIPSFHFLLIFYLSKEASLERILARF